MAYPSWPGQRWSSCRAQTLPRAFAQLEIFILQHKITQESREPWVLEPTRDGRAAMEALGPVLCKKSLVSRQGGTEQGATGERAGAATPLVTLVTAGLEGVRLRERRLSLANLSWSGRRRCGRHQNCCPRLSERSKP